MESKKPTKDNAGELWWGKLSEDDPPFLAKISVVGGLVVASRPDEKGGFFPVNWFPFIWIGPHLQEMPARNSIHNEYKACNTIQNEIKNTNVKGAQYSKEG